MTLIIQQMALGTLLLQTALALGAPVERPVVDADGTVHLPAFAVPLSRFMSDEAKRQYLEDYRAAQAEAPKTEESIAEQRAHYEAVVRPLVDYDQRTYPVAIEDRKIGGVTTQVVTPRSGVSTPNRHRVLINLHGGGFLVGAGPGGLIETIPLAAVGKFKIVTVDYRMAPEHHFPAASKDVAAVYKALLQDYAPEDIGIYGCSAGGILTAMAVAWFRQEQLPTPGAIAMLSAGAFASFSGAPAAVNTWGGDSAFLAPPLQGEPPLPVQGTPPAAVQAASDYSAGSDPLDPRASPALSQRTLAAFPPTLLMTGTRGWDMSAVIQTQRELTRAGVQADLHLWDGVGHCFMGDAHLPESQEAIAVMAEFFDRQLGHRPVRHAPSATYPSQHGN